MSVNLYVMPLWRFFAGDYDPPLARLGIPFKRLSPTGQVFDPPKAGAATPAQVALGQRKAANIAAKVRETNKADIAWDDRGDVVYNSQAGGSRDGLLAYVTWLDYGDRLPRFELSADGRYDRHPVWRHHQNLHRPATFPHLAQHSLFCGYFLPCDFERPVIAHMIKHPPFPPIPVHAASTVRLAAELEAINDLLQVPDPLDHQRFADHPYALIFSAFDQLRATARLSLQHRLPIIYEG